MKEYIFIYKCRRCGVTHDGPRTGNETIALTTLIGASINGVSRGIGASVSLISTHGCKDKGYGIADLQGFKVKE